MMGNVFFSWGRVGLLGVGKAPPFCFFGGEWGCPLRGNTAPNYFFGGGRGWVRLASDGRKHTEVGGAAQRWEKHSPLCVFGVDARIELPIDGEKHPPFDFFGVGGAAH